MLTLMEFAAKLNRAQAEAIRLQCGQICENCAHNHAGECVHSGSDQFGKIIRDDGWCGEFESNSAVLAE